MRDGVISRYLSLGYFPTSVLTSQEHLFLGSSPDYKLIREPNDFYRPVGSLDGRLQLDEAVFLREHFGVMRSNAGHMLGFRHQMLYNLEPLDESGTTIQDPTILGEINHVDEGISTIRIYPHRNLTAEFYRIYRERTKGDQYADPRFRTDLSLLDSHPRSEADTLKQLVEDRGGELLGRAIRLFPEGHRPSIEFR